MKIKLFSNSFEQTEHFGYLLANVLNPNRLIYLDGDLAAGKTTFTRGIGKGLGVKSVVNSPTFTILKIHSGIINLYHIDAYRLDGIDYDLGFEELICDGVVVVEWFQYINHILGEPNILVSFIREEDTKRWIEISTSSELLYRQLKEIFYDFMC